MMLCKTVLREQVYIQAELFPFAQKKDSQLAL